MRNVLAIFMRDIGILWAKKRLLRRLFFLPLLPVFALMIATVFVTLSSKLSAPHHTSQDCRIAMTDDHVADPLLVQLQKATGCTVERTLSSDLQPNVFSGAYTVALDVKANANRFDLTLILPPTPTKISRATSDSIHRFVASQSPLQLTTLTLNKYFSRPEWITAGLLSILLMVIPLNTISDEIGRLLSEQRQSRHVTWFRMNGVLPSQYALGKLAMSVFISLCATAIPFLAVLVLVYLTQSSVIPHLQHYLVRQPNADVSEALFMLQLFVSPSALCWLAIALFIFITNLLMATISMILRVRAGFPERDTLIHTLVINLFVFSLMLSFMTPNLLIPSWLPVVNTIAFIDSVLRGEIQWSALALTTISGAFAIYLLVVHIKKRWPSSLGEAEAA